MFSQFRAIGRWLIPSLLLFTLACSVVWQTNAVEAAPAATNGPLRADARHPHYFADASGQIVLLTGSHTWLNLQDSGKGFPPAEFDYAQYLDFLNAHQHNFFRLWVWEQSRWTVEAEGPDGSAT